MAIDNLVLLKFCDESVRNVADKGAGIFALVDAFVAAAKGKGIAELIGTTDEELFRETPWQLQDFAALLVNGAPVPITGTDRDGRALLTNIDVAGIVRFVMFVKTAKDADPAIGVLLGKVAVNPRA